MYSPSAVKHHKPMRCFWISCSRVIKKIYNWPCQGHNRMEAVTCNCASHYLLQGYECLYIQQTCYFLAIHWPPAPAAYFIKQLWSPSGPRFNPLQSLHGGMWGGWCSPGAVMGKARGMSAPPPVCKQHHLDFSFSVLSELEKMYHMLFVPRADSGFY